VRHGRRLGERPPHQGPQPLGLVAWRQVVAALDDGGKRGHAPLPPAARAEQRGQAHRAAPVQVDVVFPGVTDAAEQRHGLEAKVDGRWGGDHRGGGRGERELLGVLRVSDRGVPGRRRDELGAREQPRALVLDRLEGADRGAELLTHLGVAEPALLAPARDARRLRREQRGGEVADPIRVDVEYLFRGDGHVVQPDPGHVASQVDRFCHGDLDTAALPAVEDEPERAAADVAGLGPEHQDLCACGAENLRALAGHQPPVAIPARTRPGRGHGACRRRA
jgi:hypothetical protein